MLCKTIEGCYTAVQRRTLQSVVGVAESKGSLHFREALRYRMREDEKAVERRREGRGGALLCSDPPTFRWFLPDSAPVF